MTVVTERRLEISDVPDLTVDITANSGLEYLGQAISESEFDFDYLEWRLRREQRRQETQQIPNLENLPGQLAEMHVALVLEAFQSERVNTAPIADTALSDGIVFRREKYGAITYSRRDSDRIRIQIDGAVEVDGLIAPYEVKTSGHSGEIYSAMNPARINSVVTPLQGLFPDRQIGYLVVAPDEAFNPHYVQRFLQEDPIQSTFTDRFRMQGGTTATLPASSAELTAAAQQIHTNLRPQRRRGA